VAGNECDPVRDLVERLRESIRRAERARGLDWRFDYSAVRPAGAREVIAEVSREEVYEEVITDQGDTPYERGKNSTTWTDRSSGLEVRFMRLDPAADRPLWVATSVADIRREPAHAAELVNQLIMGEWAYPLKREGEWSLVRLLDGYHGWIHSWSTLESDREAVDSYGSRVNARVGARVGYVLSGPRDDAIPLSDVVAGTRLVAGRESGAFREVTLPNAKKGLMRKEQNEPFPPPPADRSRLIERSMRFMGIPYLWGGTSAKAFDCSGFVKRVFQLEGIELPRDSDLQSRVGTMIPPERVREARPGDLLFFGEANAVKHVAIHIERGHFIHAYGLVRTNSLEISDPDYDGKLARSLLFGRSVFNGEERGRPGLPFTVDPLDDHRVEKK
jgi:hypothetical protein